MDGPSEAARQQARAEGLTLLKADNKAGYFGVHVNQASRVNPYVAKVRRGDRVLDIGRFATAEEAALCVARSPEGQAAAKKAAMTPLTKDEALKQARAEGLELRVTGNKAGYFGVYHKPGHPRPYHARVKRGSKKVYLGYFVTAEEAALCVARSPEGQAAAGLAAAPRTPMPLTGEDAERHAAQSLREWIIEQQRLRRKELLSRWEQVLTTLAASSAEEEQEGGMEAAWAATRRPSTRCQQGSPSTTPEQRRDMCLDRTRRGSAPRSPLGT